MQQTDDYGALLALAGEISREENLDGLLRKILDKSLPWMRVDACSIFLPDEATGELVIHSATNTGGSLPDATRLSEIRVPAGKGIVGAAMRDKQLIRVDDALNDPRVYRAADEKTGWTTRALLAAPLLDGDECRGVIEFLNPVGRPAFTADDEKLVEYFAGLVAAALGRVRSQEAAIERAALQRDLDLAREMQTGLLPRQFPGAAESPGLEVFARLDPAKEVSGDLYDFFFVSPGRLCFVVGDVSGKGVAAGLFMAVTRTLVRALARPGMGPAEMLAQVNNELCRDNEACLFVTMILGIADVESGRIVCGLAAHNQPAVVRASGQVDLGPVGGIPMGLQEGGVFGEWSVELEPGDALVVYTDGVTEAMDPASRMFGAEALRRVLAAAAGRSAGEIVSEVSSAVLAHAAGADPSDDITILTLRRRGA